MSHPNLKHPPFLLIYLLLGSSPSNYYAVLALVEYTRKTGLIFLRKPSTKTKFTRPANCKSIPTNLEDSRCTCWKNALIPFPYHHLQVLEHA